MNLFEEAYWNSRSYIQRFQYENEIGYWLYLNLYRKHRGIKPGLPIKGTDLHIEGYPRSGNTFAQNLLKSTIIKNNPKLEIAHHCHATASLKLSQKFDVPTAVLLRNPSDAIASSYIKFFALRNRGIPKQTNQILLKNNIYLYNNFYQYVVENKNLNIFLFEDVIKDPFGFIQALENLLNKNQSINLSTTEDVDAGIERAKKNEMNKNPLGSSLPNIRRKQDSKDLKLILEQLDELKNGEKIFASLVKRKIQISSNYNYLNIL